MAPNQNPASALAVDPRCVATELNAKSADKRSEALGRRSIRVQQPEKELGGRLVPDLLCCDPTPLPLKRVGRARGHAVALRSRSREIRDHELPQRLSKRIGHSG